jgi:hypothetical protein
VSLEERACKFFKAPQISRIHLLYAEGVAGTVRAMLSPTPRTDRWDPWIALVLLVALIASAAAVHVLVR